MSATHPEFVTIQETLLGLTEAVSGLKATVDSMNKQLLGNGAPGRVHLMERDIEALKTSHAEARGALKAASWVAGSGALTALVSMGLSLFKAIR